MRRRISSDTANLGLRLSVCPVADLDIFEGRVNEARKAEKLGPIFRSKGRQGGVFRRGLGSAVSYPSGVQGGAAEAGRVFCNFNSQDSFSEHFHEMFLLCSCKLSLVCTAHHLKATLDCNHSVHGFTSFIQVPVLLQTKDKKVQQSWQTSALADKLTKQ